MWKFISGFSLGIYLATYYDCKPIISRIRYFMKENFPKEKEEEKVVEKKKWW